MKGLPDIEDVAEVVPEARDLQVIDSGGFKVVYKARVGKQIEAVKLVSIPSDTNDPMVRDENIRRIHREIKILGECRSPCLVRLGSISPRPCAIRGHDYMVYSEEFITGQSLRTLIKTGHRPTLVDLASLGLCLFKAVQELSGMRVIHRDIKPDNVIRTETAARPYVLLDLGIAFQLGGTQLTRDTVRVPGTLYYIAPEMLDSGFRQNLDYRADLYTVGLTLYEYACGVNPFAHCDDPQFTTLYRIKTQRPKPLHGLREDLLPQFCDLVDQLMKKVPALRPANMSALMQRMERYS